MKDLFITDIEFSKFRHISKKLDRDRIYEAIRVAQTIDLKKMLGRLYYRIYKNPDDEQFSLLFEGGEFEDCGDVISHVGIKEILADLAYSRYIATINTNLNPFGATTKITRDGQPVQEVSLKAQSKQAQLDAGDKFNEVRLYLCNNSNLFPEFARNKDTGGTFRSISISKI